MFGFLAKRNTQRVFLDYASTTPIDKDVLAEMRPYFSNKFFNSSALYQEGVEVKDKIEESRTKVARLLMAKSGDIYFTGSGTESNNISILGVFDAAIKNGIAKPHIVVTEIEHPAVLEVAKEIETRGGEVTYLSVDERGLVSGNDLKNSLKENTVLVSVIYANNEIGTIQPIRSISRVVKKYKEELERDTGSYPYLHTDASQAPNYLDCNVNKLGVDLMTLDGHKIYGPKGVSCLYVNNHVDINPVMFGGGQEGGLRSGTLNVPNIVGFTKALQKASEIRGKETNRVSQLQKYFINEIKQIIPSASINGSQENRLPNNVNICIPNINAELEVIRLDAKGIACAYTTACKTSEDDSESHVVKAVAGKDCAASSLRFTLGRGTIKKDIQKTLDVLKEIDYEKQINYNLANTDE